MASLEVRYERGKDPGGVLVALGRLRDAAATAGGARLSVTSDLPYAYGIETGYHRGGRLARRRGGAFMFRTGLQRGFSSLEREVARALPDGPPAVTRAYLAAGRRTVEEVRRGTPVVSGRLRASVRMTLEAGG